MAARLRVYRSPEDSSCTGVSQPTVRISLEDLLPLIALAQKNGFVWLQDFIDDEVVITEDLYEVLQAFRSYRPSA
ncbi:MAG: hypothetical protein K2R98_10120 [Gemmataceae bacterium]|nr:hypothetical protein [Gemmataceae bacterium]